MMKRRGIAFLLSVILCLSATLLPTLAEASVSLLVGCEAATDRETKLGDLLTYTVTVTANADGFDTGTIYFLPSDNLTYVSATRLGQPCEAKVAVTGEHEGAYGIAWIDTNPYTASGEVYCTMTFRVTDLGPVSMKVDAFQLAGAGGEVAVTLQPTGGVIEHTVAEPAKPTVMTEALSKAVLNQGFETALSADREDYLVWRLADGTLPSGVTLSEDGVLSGTPTEQGTFTFSVVASVLGKIDSDPRQLTLTVLERPQKLELIADSAYRIDEAGYLHGVSLQTSLANLLAQFENSDGIVVKKADASALTSQTALIGTGYTVELVYDGEILDSLTVVVRGDLNGDGRVGMVDYSMLVSHLRLSDLDGARLEAAKIAGNRTVGMIDYSKMVSFLRDGTAF